MEEYNHWDNLKKLPAYQNSFLLSKMIYELAKQWDNFDRHTVGLQIIRSSDSVGANIAEGYGRYFFKDKLRFYYNARGSLLETKDWMAKITDRQIITKDQETQANRLTNTVLKDLTILISNTRNQIQ